MITINVSAGAKRPHPTEQYANISVQVGLVGEAGSLADVPEVMRTLLTSAQAGADRHLAEQLAAATGQPPAATVSLPAQASSQPATAPNSQPRQASQPYRNNGQRRQPALCSAAQARYLRQLGERNPAALTDALAQHGVRSIEELPARAASQAIDLILQGVA